MAAVTGLCLDMRVAGDWAGSPVPKCQIFHVFLLNLPDLDLTDIWFLSNNISDIVVALELLFQIKSQEGNAETDTSISALR